MNISCDLCGDDLVPPRADGPFHDEDRVTCKCGAVHRISVDPEDGDVYSAGYMCKHGVDDMTVCNPCEIAKDRTSLVTYRNALHRASDDINRLSGRVAELEAQLAAKVSDGDRDVLPLLRLTRQHIGDRVWSALERLCKTAGVDL